MKFNNSIQVLRAVAAIMVVVHHLIILATQYGLWEEQNSSLSIGVDIFFLLSGYIMTMLVDTSPCGMRASWIFLLARLKKILPLYWTISLLTIFLVSIGWLSVWENRSYDWPYVISSFLLVPDNAWPYSRPLVNVGWTLIYEMAFYLVMTIAILLPRKFRYPFSLVLIGGGYMVGELYHLSGAWAFYLDRIIILFPLGGAIYYLNGFTLKKPFYVMICIFCLLAGGWSIYLLWGLGDNHGGISWNVVSLLILIGGLSTQYFIPWERFSPLVKIGNASYSLYLTHILFFPAFGWLLGLTGNKTIMCVILLVSLVICILFSHVVYYTLEKNGWKVFKKGIDLFPRRFSNLSMNERIGL